LDMTEDLSHVLALELYTAAQALEYRQDMLNAARTLAARGDWQALARKISGAPASNSPHYAQFEAEVKALMKALAASEDFHAGTGVKPAFDAIRKHIDFMRRDRSMDTDIRRICELVAGQGV
ncbi:MAG TPA: aromatic amino acid lyase, partial [Rudaea sp.]|nr:aromatic amino acid lyase [Rudaea sp.]